MKLLVFLLLGILTFNLKAQNTSYDTFFSKHPVDINLGMHAYNYTIHTLDNKDEIGLNSTIAFGLGWRYTFFTLGEFAFSTRTGVEGGYWKDDLSNSATFQIPITLNLSYGAGSHAGCRSKYGFILGGGIAENMYSYVRRVKDVSYSQASAFLSPHVFCGVKMTKDGSDIAYGIYPSLSWQLNNYFVGLKLVVDVIYQ